MALAVCGVPSFSPSLHTASLAVALSPRNALRSLQWLRLIPPQPVVFLDRMSNAQGNLS